MEPIIALKCLLQINGGHTAVDLANCLISVIAKHINIKGSAYHKIQSYLETTHHDYDSNVSPTEYFKLGVIHYVNKNDKEIDIETKNMPIANTGDGIALNGGTSLLLCLCYGFDAPCYQCAAHSSDLVMKQMAKSKTMSVPEVVKTYDCLRRVSKHFEMSTKSEEKLNEALATFEMNQLKLLLWGGTRMAHFVSACKKFTKPLPAIYNCVYSTDIKKEERHALFTVENSELQWTLLTRSSQWKH